MLLLFVWVLPISYAGAPIFAYLRQLKDVNTTGIADGKILKYDLATKKWIMADDSGGAGPGDNVTVNGTDVDTTANFKDGDILMILVDGGSGGPDDITMSYATDSIKDTHIDWGTGATQVSLADIPAYENTVIISKDGDDVSVFTTIQGALDANTDGDTLFIVYSGTYTNDTIFLTANNQCIKGAGCSPKGSLITNNSKIIDYGAFTGGIIDNVKAVMTLAANDFDTVVDGSGSLNIKFSHLEAVASGSNNLANTGTTVIQGTGTVKVVEGSIVYTNSAIRGSRGKKAVLTEDGSSYIFDDVAFVVTGSNSSGTISAVRDSSTGTFTVDKCDFEIEDNDSTVTYALSIIDGSGEDEVTFNTVHVSNSTNDAVAMYASGSATGISVRSSYNHVHVEAPSGTANIIVLANSDTEVISQFDDYVSADGVDNTSGGTYTFVKSGNDGELEVSTGINGEYLTASELLATDASKNLVSLAVATYPSLAEVAWLKGMTSKVIDDDQIDTFAELDAIVADKTLLNTTNTASTTALGIVEMAIGSEVDTGTSTTLAVTPDALQASKRNIRYLTFILVEAGTANATATNITGDFVSPVAGTILQSDTTPFYLYATNSTAGINTGVGLVVDIKLGGTSIMTTNKLDFDTTEKTTTTASTPPDLTDTTIAVGDILTIDITSIHDGTASKGLILYMAVLEN